MTDWSKLFKELFPEAYANDRGHWWWQEMNLLFDLHIGQHSRHDELKYWCKERKNWDKRTDEYGIATRERIERIIVLLVQHKMRKTG